MSTPAFNAGNFARSALQSITLYLVIMTSMMAMANPAHAEDATVKASPVFWGGPNAGGGYNCNGMASLAGLQNCTQSWYKKLLTDDHARYTGLGASDIVTCPDPSLKDLGATGGSVDSFEITHHRIVHNCGGFGFYCYYVTFCQLQPLQTFHVYTTQACPTNTTTPTPPCTCKDGYLPDTLKTQCIKEQYSIALVGLGVEVMPNKKLETAYALVTKNDGSAKSGAQVTLLYDFVPEEDSFNHADGQHIEPHRGSVSATSGSTDEKGKFSFIFTAPVAGGTHTITAKCNDCTNEATGKITVPGCTVPPLKELPAGDACAQSLNAGLGVDVNGKCPPLDARLPKQMQCFVDKIAATNLTASPKIPYDGPTAKYRSTAYQDHLKDIWDKMIELDNLSDPAKIMACQPLRNKVIAEKGCDSSDGCSDECVPGSHCIRNAPATSSNHTQGTAFDVSKDTIKELLNELIPRPPAPMTPLQLLLAQRIWIADWLAKPTACNLYWGGNFTNPKPDFVHFQLP